MIQPRRRRHNPPTDSGQTKLDKLTLGMRSAITKTTAKSPTALNGRTHRNPPAVTLPTLRCLETKEPSNGGD